MCGDDYSVLGQLSVDICLFMSQPFHSSVLYCVQFIMIVYLSKALVRLHLGADVTFVFFIVKRNDLLDNKSVNMFRKVCYVVVLLVILWCTASMHV